MYVVALRALHGCTAHCLPRNGGIVLLLNFVRKQSIRVVPNDAGRNHPRTALTAVYSSLSVCQRSVGVVLTLFTSSPVFIGTSDRSQTFPANYLRKVEYLGDDCYLVHFWCYVSVRCIRYHHAEDDLKYSRALFISVLCSFHTYFVVVTKLHTSRSYKNCTMLQYRQLKQDNSELTAQLNWQRCTVEFDQRSKGGGAMFLHCLEACNSKHSCASNIIHW